MGNEPQSEDSEAYFGDYRDVWWTAMPSGALRILLGQARCRVQVLMGR